MKGILSQRQEQLHKKFKRLDKSTNNRIKFISRLRYIKHELRLLENWAGRSSDPLIAGFAAALYFERNLLTQMTNRLKKIRFKKI